MKLTPDALAALRACMLFRQLDQDTFLDNARVATLQHLADNELLFETGDPADRVFLLLKGRIKLVRLTRSGDEKIIDIIHPGQTFAEAILFMRGDRFPVHAVALGESSVIGIEARTYRDTLSSSVDSCFTLMALMSKRIHWLVNEVDRLTLHNATYRLANFLLEEAHKAGLTKDGQLDPVSLNLAIPKHVIASRLSIKPETLSRTFKHLVKEGLIEVNTNRIDLLKIDELQELVLLG